MEDEVLKTAQRWSSIPTRYASSKRFSFECNWKLYVENWLESYHIAWLHSDLKREVDIATYKIRAEQEGVFHTAHTQKPDAVYAGSWEWNWPSLAWNRYRDGFSIEQIIPLDVCLTEINYHFFFTLKASSQFQKAVFEMCETTTNEDGRMCEKVQHNIQSGLFKPGPLSPIHEGAISTFHGKYLRKMETVYAGQTATDRS